MIYPASADKCTGEALIYEITPATSPSESATDGGFLSITVKQATEDWAAKPSRNSETKSCSAAKGPIDVNR